MGNSIGEEKENALRKSSAPQFMDHLSIDPDKKQDGRRYFYGEEFQRHKDVK